MAIQYVMVAFNVPLNKKIYWYSIGSPDFVGTLSGYNPSDLTGITIDYTADVPNNVGVGNLNLLTGQQGAPGPSTISAQVAFTSATIPAGHVAQEDINNKIKLATSSIKNNRFVGIVLSITVAGGIANLQIKGPLDVNIFNLGVGARCAVGINSSGTPVRVTSSFMASGPNYIGWCDENGAIFIEPRISDNINIRDFGAVGDGITDDTAAIQAAINICSSSGGTIFFPGNTYNLGQININKPISIKLDGTTLRGNSSVLFNVTSNLNFEGEVKKTNVLSCNGSIFSITGSVEQAGQDGYATFILRNCTLEGIGSNSIAFDTTNLPFGYLNSGMILIEQNNFLNFTGTAAIYLTPAVAFTKILRNYFISNYRSIWTDYNSDCWIEQNEFLQAQNAVEQIYAVGPDVHIERNVLVQYDQNNIGNNSNPDVLLVPTNSDSSGGYIWIRGNRFSGEGERANHLRSRIKCFYSGNSNYASAPVWIEDNLFAGGSPITATSMSRDGTGLVTVSSSPLPHNAQNGGIFNIISASDTSFEGTYAITVIDQFTLTYQQANVTISTISNGTLYLTNNRAIQLLNPIDRWTIINNHFIDYGIIIDDVQGNGNALRRGQSLFIDNTVHIIQPINGYTVFTNGGRQFSEVIMPDGSAQDNFSSQILKKEQVKLENKLLYSEDFTQSIWAKNNPIITVTTGQTDPFGTTRACLISRDGNLAAQSISQIWTQNPGQIFVSFWAKSNTINNLTVAIEDHSVPQFIDSMYCSLSSEWKRYCLPVQLYSSGTSFRLYFYVGEENFALSGSIYLFGVQVSSKNSDYIPTTSVSFSDTTVGSRFELAPIVSSLKVGTQIGPYAQILSGNGVPATTPQDGSLYLRQDGYADSGLYVYENNVWLPLQSSIVINVKSFGAKGDGITDDTVPIQNAINTAAISGGVVFFPDAIYAHSNTITVPSGIVLQGSGYIFYSATHSQLKGAWLKWIGTAGSSTSSPHTQLLLFDVNNVKIQNLGILGNSAAFVNGIQLDSDNSPSTFQVTMEGVTFAEHAVSVQVGPYSSFTDTEVDMIRMTDCYFVNYSDAGIRVNSVNAIDNSVVNKCRWFSSVGSGTGSGAIGIDLKRNGNLTIEAAAFGSDIGIQINGSFANAITVINSQLEAPFTWFLKLTGNMASPITLVNNTINVGVYLGGFCRIVGLGNYYAASISNITLDSAGAYYDGFGEVIDTTSSGVIVLSDGFFTNHNVGDPNFYHTVSSGTINWQPQSQSLFTNVAAEKITRTGRRAPLWNFNTPYSLGDYRVPKTSDNGHVYQAQNGGTSSSSTEPIWPLGSGSTVNDNGITWKESGVSAQAKPFGPLGQMADSAPPSSGFWPVGSLVYNTTPNTNGIFAWICVVSGNPGTWTSVILDSLVGALQQTDWYIDWNNGNDGYDGTISNPVKTVMGGVVAKWGTNSPLLKQTTTLHIVSSQPLGAEEIILSPQLSGGVNFNIVGTPHLVGSPTLNVVTQKNRTTNTNFHSTGLTGFTDGQLLVNTTLGKSSSCFIRSVSSDDGYLTQPLTSLSPGDNVFEPVPSEVDTWSHNDTTDAYTLPTINLQSLNITCGSSTDGSTNSSTFLKFLHILDASGSPGFSVFSPLSTSNYLTFADCIIEPYLVAHGSYDLNLVNCYINGGELDHAWIIGGIVKTFALIVFFPCWIDGDFIADVGTGIFVSGPEIILGYVNNASIIKVHPQSTAREVGQAYGAGNAVVWGLGTIDTEPGAIYWNNTGNSWATSVFCTPLTIDGNTTATKYVSGTWTDGITINVTNLDGYNSLQNPLTGSRYTK